MDDAEQVKDYKQKENSLWLQVMLDLKRLPVGIRFLYSEDDYKECELLEPTNPRPYCVAVKNATQGEACKIGLEHIACLSGARVLGILSPSQDIVNPLDVRSGRRHCLMGLYADYGISRQIAKDMTYCPHNVCGIEVAPLTIFQNDDPDVVIIVSNAMNIMRVVQGYAYHYGQLKNIKMTGNQAICQECTSYPFEMNQPNISMLCAGTRKAARWSDDELAIGIPFNQLEKIIDGIRKTSNAMDDNTTKKLILERAEKMAVTDQVNVKLNSNYYTGGFGTLAYHQRKQQKS